MQIVSKAFISMKKLLVLFLPLLLITCQQDLTQSMDVTQLSTPSSLGSNASNIYLSESGKVYLTWIEKEDTIHKLIYTTLENDAWSAPKTIASGNNWFVNWADFPTLVSNSDDSKIAVHWLQKRSVGTYDYDVHISQSLDGGATWSPSFIPHRDSIAAEHGFVSMVSLDDEKIFATWLDGRNTKGDGHDNHDGHGHGHGGAMTLRSAVFDFMGNLTDESELDNRICDCCQTSAAKTENGLIVAYRDRSEEEIRDIAVVRFENENWTNPQIIGDDNWKIEGCPVNGPVVASQGKNVAVAWFTAANEKPKVQVALSTDNGKTFGSPITINNAKTAGRVDTKWSSDGHLVISWMEEQGEKSVVMMAFLNSNGKELHRQEITAISPSRSSGFPRFVAKGHEFILTWTAVEDKETKVESAKIFF